MGTEDAELRWLIYSPDVQCDGSEHRAVFEEADKLVLGEAVHRSQDADVDDVPGFFPSTLTSSPSSLAAWTLKFHL